MTDDDRRAATTAELEATKAVVAQAIARIFNGGDLDAADELYAPDIAADAKAWVAPFRESFPDVQVTTVALIAEGNTVVGHFHCSGTHLGRWLGREPAGCSCSATLVRPHRPRSSWGWSRCSPGRTSLSTGVRTRRRRRLTRHGSCSCSRMSRRSACFSWPAGPYADKLPRGNVPRPF